MRLDDIRDLHRAVGTRGFVSVMADLLEGKDQAGKTITKLRPEELPGAAGRFRPPSPIGFTKERCSCAGRLGRCPGPWVFRRVSLRHLGERREKLPDIDGHGLTGFVGQGLHLGEGRDIAADVHGDGRYLLHTFTIAS